MGSTPEGRKTTNQTSYFAYITAPETIANQSLLLDIGASHHVNNNLSNMQHVTKYNGETKLVVRNGEKVPIHNVGSTIFEISTSKPIYIKKCHSYSFNFTKFD